MIDFEHQQVWFEPSGPNYDNTYYQDRICIKQYEKYWSNNGNEGDPAGAAVPPGSPPLRRMIGGRGIMRDQLSHLVTILELPNVTVRVLSFVAGEHPATHGAFSVLEFPDPDDPHIVYLDVLTTSYYLNDLREVGAYHLAHERLRALALGPDESRSMIAALGEESEP